jgi:hypothetical protein
LQLGAARFNAQSLQFLSIHNASIMIAELFAAQQPNHLRLILRNLKALLDLRGGADGAASEGCPSRGHNNSRHG